MQKGKVFNGIYEVVKEIPKGKVATYGQISSLVNGKFLVERDPALQEKLENRDKRVTPRVVGWALHANSDPKNIPCHRVVRKDGSLAKGYAFSSKGRSVSGGGGKEEQKKRLVREGIQFVSRYKVDMSVAEW